MRLLLDTHFLLWTFLDSGRLSRQLSEAILDDTSQVFYNPTSLWEIAIKYRLGKLRLSGITPEEFGNELSGSFLRALPLDDKVILSSYRLPGAHKDPFDRILAWQAIQEDCTFVSSNPEFRSFEPSGLKLFPNPSA